MNSKEWLCPSAHIWTTQLRLGKVWREGQESQPSQFSPAWYSRNSNFCWYQLWAVMFQKHVWCISACKNRQDRFWWNRCKGSFLHHESLFSHHAKYWTILFHPHGQNLTLTRTNSRSKARTAVLIWKQRQQEISQLNKIFCCLFLFIFFHLSHKTVNWHSNI